MRQARIHDTLSGRVRTLDPRDPPRVGMYVCGPTVYGRIHVGNARPYVLFSLLKRFLEHEGYDTQLVVNITDVNDKIYDAARERGVSSEELAGEMTAAYLADTEALGLGRPDHEPKATENIGPIIALIESLIERGHAYESDGDVLFRVASFDGYGKLSNRPLEEMQQGEGDDAAEHKESPQDFALWKARKEDEDSTWDSPWGEGRPGWHIECSAMAEELLGVDFEIHGGGSDLVFPHHENEIAYTEEAMEDAARAVSRVREVIRRLDPDGPAAAELDAKAERFFNQLSDDFNTPAARAVLFDWVAEANRRLDAGERLGAGRLGEMLYALGLESLLERGEGEAPEEIEHIAAEREAARAARDFERADRLRDQLAERGWEIRDTPDGARLVR